MRWSFLPSITPCPLALLPLVGCFEATAGTDESLEESSESDETDAILSMDESGTSDDTTSDDTTSDDTTSGDAPFCGDGIVQTGEECDQGQENGPGYPCTSSCQLNECGDAEVGPGEACDDGNAVDDDECSNTCATPLCGDGIVQDDEACDDENAADFDGCTSQCTSTELPVLELTVVPIKQFEFSWPPVSGAEYYQLLERADVGEDFVQVGGDIVGELTALTVPLHFRVNASYKLRACDAQGCGESAVVDAVGSLAEAVGYFKASNTGAGDHFARVAMSADGNTLAISAYDEDSSATGIGGNQADNSAANSGAVYVFARNGNAWSQQAYLKASNTGASDWFGWGMALSADGHTLAVGAYWEDSNATGIGGEQANNSAADAGAVYVFARSGNVWSQQAYVKASNSGAGDRFGWSVALSGDGNTLAVGAYGEDSNATGIGGDQTSNLAPDAGAVYVFVRSVDAWSQQAYVKASNTGVDDMFGESVAVSSNGDTLVVGAYREDSNAVGVGGDQANNSASSAGAGYVFVRSGNAWSQQAYIKASNPGTGDAFGYDVALSADGGTLAIAAYYEDSSATGIDGDQADNSALDAGAVYVFTFGNNAWTQQAYVKASNTDAGDTFGRYALALSGDGNTLAVPAHQEDGGAIGIGGNQVDDSASGAGAVYLFTRSGNAWAQEAYVKAPNTDVGDTFGVSLALSGDANTLAVGAHLEDSNATGVGGDQSSDATMDAGAVYLY